MDDNIVHLNVWGGDWDLPSVDPNCLAALVCIIEVLIVLNLFLYQTSMLDLLFI